MATGTTGAPGNIPFPTGGDQYALTSDLQAMASQTNLGLANAGGPDDPRPPLTHGHAIAEVQGLTEGLAGKADEAALGTVRSEVDNLAEAVDLDAAYAAYLAAIA